MTQFQRMYKWPFTGMTYTPRVCRKKWGLFKTTFYKRVGNDTSSPLSDLHWNVNPMWTPLTLLIPADIYIYWFLRWFAAFLRSLCFFWHPYWHTYIWCMSEHHSCHICHICHKWHIWHIWHLAFDIYLYVNMGVKRSVKTSGMQPTILDIPNNCFKGQKLEYHIFWFFLCIFQNFLCIFWVKSSLERSPSLNLIKIYQTLNNDHSYWQSWFFDPP